ncbi:tRNA (cytidine(56)-2'-O)-methyltransferase [Candidatus Bathyarchaeota archaeon]|nr:tRNA (cytidine(56)-2'-O)-methyltransferase [Candidatus Bathyarchaeota archaeon]
MNITVLRLGHRPQRDKRLSTHLILCARALGAGKVVYSGDRDPRLEEGVTDIVDRWGGEFSLEYEENWRRVVKEWVGNIVHLTMYGVPVEETAPAIGEEDKPLLVVVGGPKVPRDMYEKATWNISVTNQPHSEVSALAIFMYLLQGDKALKHDFPGASINIKPSEHGKDVEVSKD